MKERPILFSANMVRAILADNKTQTRRTMKPTKAFSAATIDELAPVMRARKWHQAVEMGPCDGVRRKYACPYGKPGDRLWVRERFRYYHDAQDLWDCIQYADGSMRKPDGLGEADGHRFSERCSADAPWRPSIHMPRWGSRITLAISDVRVERLHDISVDDCVAEGMHPHPKDHVGPPHEFMATWLAIHGPGAWALNPWVWVIEFWRLPNAQAQRRPPGVPCGDQVGPS
jgi:hypothetical protein